MNDATLVSFGHDPWWVVVLKVVLIFGVCVLLTLFNIWWERRVVARRRRVQAIATIVLDVGAAIVRRQDFAPLPMLLHLARRRTLRAVAVAGVGRRVGQGDAAGRQQGQGQQRCKTALHGWPPQEGGSSPARGGKR